MLDYRPDLDPRTPEVLLSVRDMLPTQKGYKPSLAATAHTAHTYSLQANEVYPTKLFASRWLSQSGGIVIVGTNQRLNVYDFTNGFINVSKAGNYSLAGQVYQTGEDAIAAFDLCAFGDVIIAVNKSTATQFRSALDLTSGTLFADLTGAPVANTCCVALNFVFLGDCGSWSTVTGARDVLAWSAIGDHTDWDVDPQVTQASYAQFNDTPGAITCVRPFRDGIVVFKATSMYRGRYVGAGTNSSIWDFERISDKIGCVGHRSIVDTEIGLVFATSDDDLCLYDGTRPTSITHGFTETFRAAVTGLSGNGTIAPRLGYDRPNASVWVNITTGTYVWNFKLNRWGFFNDGFSTPPALCQTNADDFTTQTLSSVSLGVQAYTTSSNHTRLCSLMIATGVPYNRVTTVATTGRVLTGSWGQPDVIRAMKRVTPLYSSRPVTASTASITLQMSKTAGDMTAGPTKALDANYRADLLASAITSNYFRIQHDCSQDHEIIGFDVDPNLIKAGIR